MKKNNIRVSRRVLSQYMRNAGLFEAPPKIFEEVVKRATSEFAKKYMEMLEEEIKTSESLLQEMSLGHYGTDSLRDEIQKFSLWADDFNYDIGDSYKMYAMMPRGGDFVGESYTFSIVITRMNDSGTFEAKTIMEVGNSRVIRAEDTLYNTKDLVSFVEKEGKILLRLAESFAPDENKINKKIADLENLIQKVNKDVYLAFLKQGRIKLNFSGWKYLENKDPSDIYSLLQKKGLETVKLIVSPEEDKWKGSWSFDGKNEGRIWVGIPEKIYPGFKWYQKEKENLKDICEHEVMHLGQDYLPIIKELEGLFGLPPGKRPADRSRMDLPEGHYLSHPHEFYPWLRNEISRFDRAKKNYPRKDWTQLAKEWMGAVPPSIFNSPSKFFVNLKKENPSLWKKAVKEFLKEI